MTIRDGLRAVHDLGPCPAVPLQDAAYRRGSVSGAIARPAPSRASADRSHIKHDATSTERQRRYRAKDREGWNEYQRAYRAAHREEINAAKRAKRAAQRAA